MLDIIITFHYFILFSQVVSFDNFQFDQVTDWSGSEIDLAADQIGRRIIFPSGGVLVTNGTLHHHILEIISHSQTSTL